jgi:diadenosine tetraphosphate (Ap4A) HIT family hydrolase
MEKVGKNFLRDSHYIADLKLCSIRLIDNSRFPWIILVPRIKNVTDIAHLSEKNQTLLMREIVRCSNIMKKMFKAFNINVEKIGNIVPQLHIHIIARSKKDDVWPLPVWVVKRKPYSKANLNKTIGEVKTAFKGK